ncbi:MAG: glycerophosphodiester phosphodiesterase [Ignavibacteriales bacterium]|nr:glycerophosphodiester phosphodiesterase [Ignavibacteriales bacterium]
MKRFYLVSTAILLLLQSCNNIVEVVQPEVDPAGFLLQTTPIPDSSKKIMDGIYSVIEGKEKFGEQVAVKWNGNNLSIFTSVEAGYLVLQGGSLDSVIFFMGYWRYATSTETGLISLYVPRNDGGKNILDNDTTDLNIVFYGSYGMGTNLSNKKLQLKYLRPFSEFVKQSDFEILAHRGGGRNSEYLGVSENTIEMISKAESFGATGIEIDIKVSNDGVPFLYHDSDINLRVTQKSVIWGEIENFSWLQLSLFIKLKNGEQIPSLRKALEFVLENTDLKFVWLDLKSETNELSKVEALQKEILERAAALNRDLQIVLGLPDEDKINNLLAYPGFENIPSLCELEINQVHLVNARVWAPRWTQGTQTSLVEAMHSEGRKVFVWTLDEPAFIESFIRDGKFDGILTNYPSLVAYYHYIR